MQSLYELKPDLKGRGKLLDVGCGSGQEIDRLRLENIDIHGIDIDDIALEIARQKNPKAIFQNATSTNIPYKDKTFDAVISSVALPYVNIQNSLQEIARVLEKDGYLWLSMHSVNMTFGYFLFYIRKLRPKPTLFTFYALINGVWFHLTGRTFCFPFFRHKYESFQTKRGMRLALKRAGFTKVRILCNGKLYVECVKK